MVFEYEANALYVDLTKDKFVKKTIPRHVVRGYIGGRGINIREIYDKLKQGTDALDPNNLIAFGVGPITGTFAPACGKTRISSLSPLTGFIGDSSIGGDWGPELRYAGITNLFITGRASHPVYLWVKDDQYEIRDARDVWGKLVRETDDIIRDEVGDQDAQVFTIGPAGERLVRYATIATNSYSVSGRTGMGAVMGSKNLKAIAVRGTKGVKVADPEIFERLSLDTHAKTEAEQRFQTSSGIGLMRGSVTALYGVGASVRAHERAKLHPDIFLSEYMNKRKTCFGCPVHCLYYYVVPEPVPGYGGNLPANPVSKAVLLKIDNWPEALKLDEICHDYGLDIDSAGSAVNWAIESYKAGMLDKDDYDGQALEWDTEITFELMRKIAFREGIGDLLAEGAVSAAEKVGKGSELFTYHVKGFDLKGKGYNHYFNVLAHAVSGRGGCHTRTQCFVVVRYVPPREAEERFGTREAMSALSTDGKAKMVKYYEDLIAVVDSLGMCSFLPAENIGGFRWDELLGLFNAATGYQLTKAEFMRCGERILTLERLFNIKQGLTRKDDTMQPRFIRVPKNDDEKRRDLNQMLDDYYTLRGWELDGIPKKEKLEELKIDAARALEGT